MSVTQPIPGKGAIASQLAEPREKEFIPGK